MKRFIVFALSMLVLLPAVAEKRYVTDKLHLQLRTGPGNEFRILKSLKSGAHLNLIETDSSTGFSKVNTDKGLEGWVLTRFLEIEPIAFERLILTERELDKVKTDFIELQTKFSETKKTLSELNRVHDAASNKSSAQGKELEHIKKVSANAINLDKKNNELMQQNEGMEIKIDTLKGENERLHSAEDLNYLIYGGLLVLVGIFLGWLLPKLSQKRGDGWH